MFDSAFRYTDFIIDHIDLHFPGFEQLKDAINFDGFIYCIIDDKEEINVSTEEKHNTKTCKIGKTKMKDSSESTLQELLRRYSTYWPDCKIYKYIRVSNRHEAEKNIFKMLKKLHYKKEIFYWNEKVINDAFNEIELKYPNNINEIIKKLDSKTLNQLNRNLRQI